MCFPAEIFGCSQMQCQESCAMTQQFKAQGGHNLHGHSLVRAGGDSDKWHWMAQALFPVTNCLEPAQLWVSIFTLHPKKLACFQLWAIPVLGFPQSGFKTSLQIFPYPKSSSCRSLHLKNKKGPSCPTYPTNLLGYSQTVAPWKVVSHLPWYITLLQVSIKRSY